MSRYCSDARRNREDQGSVQVNERILAAHKRHLESKDQPRPTSLVPLSQFNLPTHLQTNPGNTVFSKPYMPMNLGEPILVHKPFHFSTDSARRKESIAQKIKRHLSNAGSKVNRSKSFYHKGVPMMLEKPRVFDDVVSQIEARRTKLGQDMSLSESSLLHPGLGLAQHQQQQHHHQKKKTDLVLTNTTGAGVGVPKKVQPPAVIRQLRHKENQSFRAKNTAAAASASSTLPPPTGRPSGKPPAPKAPPASAAAAPVSTPVPAAVASSGTDSIKRSASVHTTSDLASRGMMPRSPKAHRNSFFKGFRRKKTYSLET
ncbi:unnamed protein product [Notodromas monacha]|uniref:Uncharacterized protein n=1 Tax=Notodromas monacha TaxID=399045 RepID=A0A7R9BSH0_9CRUS|nr:unnamed protein product [Notodromas monacha]CAG0920572.1 unnamed protein product [Notodromas monacha]